MEFSDEEECLYSGGNRDPGDPNALIWLWFERSETSFQAVATPSSHGCTMAFTEIKWVILCYSSTQEIVTQEKGAAARNELWNDAELLSMLISVNNIPDRESSQALWKTFLNLEKCEIQRRPLAINLVFLSHYFQLVLFFKKIFFFLFC